ncbi:MAG: type VI secretion system receptor/chaperone Hcp [Burkholderiaceae bacterium]
MAQGDMFLKIEGMRQGSIKGEAKDSVHIDEIDVMGWSWGMEGNLAHGQATSKTSVRELKICKRVDKATTGLMAALRSNEILRKAVLTVRKAGAHNALPYYTITMEKGRITSLMQHTGADNEPAVLQEDLSIAFSKFSVEYKPQGDDGQMRGSTLFEMDIFFGDR